MLITLIIIFVLLVLSAFFSGSETALTAASRPLMHQLEQSGNVGAVKVNRLLDNRERLISTILLGNNLVNILASALATSILITLAGDAGVVYATLAMTVMVLVFSEILPKTYAIRNADQMSLAIAPVVRTLVYVLLPVTGVINLFVRGLLKIFGVSYRAGEAFSSTAEELRGAIDLHSSEDREIEHERAMLRSVLDLTEVQVGEILIHRKDVTMIDAGQSPEKVVEEVLASPYTRIPLWLNEPENIVGVLHAKALLRAVRAQKEGDILDVVKLAAKPWFIPEQTNLLDQLQAFRQRQEHFALMVDEYGSLMGIVTLEDILEEIVGEISDEHDEALPGVVASPDGSYIAQGSVTIRDLNREFGWGLADEEAATIAGLILHEARRLPEQGQVFMFHGMKYEILRRVRQQITSIKITPQMNSEPLAKK